MKSTADWEVVVGLDKITAKEWCFCENLTLTD